ncbi:uncharacterized protein TEOVI_000861100 [Trypanosoma equiperdum]|uniref:Variant surface glycoprotein (VSG) n=2 Tax=Trypanozoon TaxID=39700 RepID=Q380X0_TRYB2|nr:hypothetical protein Tb11.17.0001 [Trypanosoma brucei brucei TREU927]EAN80661.1 hypothetical protein Tb11.17.0001 [Trypanosoma brucei brucei TREU927]SCU66512.1 hypothetical protein, conserved [Trypanosoma equiperdum]
MGDCRSPPELTNTQGNFATANTQTGADCAFKTVHSIKFLQGQPPHGAIRFGAGLCRTSTSELAGDRNWGSKIGELEGVKQHKSTLTDLDTVTAETAAPAFTTTADIKSIINTEAPAAGLADAIKEPVGNKDVTETTKLTRIIKGLFGDVAGA